VSKPSTSLSALLILRHCFAEHAIILIGIDTLIADRQRLKRTGVDRGDWKKLYRIVPADKLQNDK
jgi:hypothetical protein